MSFNLKGHFLKVILMKFTRLTWKANLHRYFDILFCLIPLALVKFEIKSLRQNDFTLSKTQNKSFILTGNSSLFIIIIVVMHFQACTFWIRNVFHKIIYINIGVVAKYLKLRLSVHYFCICRKIKMVSKMFNTLLLIWSFFHLLWWGRQHLNQEKLVS